jgi:hypothetical protein
MALLTDNANEDARRGGITRELAVDRIWLSEQYNRRFVIQ